jgi:predicted Fe-Mo cluster-binding NifX family protein
MKIAITASGDNLDCQMDSRFGRCQNFLIIDQDTMDFEVMSNESAMTSGGAGIQAAQTIVNTGINALITGNVGPNAYEILLAAGIETMTGASGTVRQALEQYKNGILQPASGATVGAHAGMPNKESGQHRRQGSGTQRKAGIIADKVQTKITIKENQISMLEQELDLTQQLLAQLTKKLDDVKK